MDQIPLFRTDSGQAIRPHRPEPISAHLEVVAYRRRMPPGEALEALLAGYTVLIVDFFSSGLAVLKAVKDHVNKQYRDSSFLGQREQRAAYRSLSHRVVLQIKDNQLVVRKAPEIGWLQILYPDMKDFVLPFPQVQGLNSAWQWYVKGLEVPVLQEKLHPYYGTYFPTRFEHLLLFDGWLKNFSGARGSAYDMGVGSGVLSLMLLKHGFQQIRATDSNPNAVIGTSAELHRRGLRKRVHLTYGKLFAGCEEQADLIVFNPPWIPDAHRLGGIDQAIYYDEQLFPAFFQQAQYHLNPDGRLVLLFSNLATITKQAVLHPIEQELQTGGRFYKEDYFSRPVGVASAKTRRNQSWRSRERVECWVLKLQKKD